MGRGSERRHRRRAAAAMREMPGTDLDPVVRGHESTSSALHAERLDAVAALLVAGGARTVLDLGCGSGALVRRLLREERFTRIVGLDQSLQALRHAQGLIEREHPDALDRVAFQHGSFMDPEDDLAGFDAAVLVEAIEHVEPSHLSMVEKAVFETVRPRLAIITTPNREYNVLYGMEERELRHADHRFEWTRPKLRAWAEGVAERNGYRAEFRNVGPLHPIHGGPTQLAAFTRG